MNTFRIAFCWVLLAGLAIASGGVAREELYKEHVSRWYDNAGPHLLSALPTTDRNLSYYHQSDLLVLTFYQSDMDFAADGEGNNADGKVHNMHFGWETAYRGTWGVHGVNSAWDVHFQHTHACSKISKHVEADDGFLAPLFWINVGDAVEAESAKFMAKIDYNVLDLVAAHSFFINEHLAFIPYGGLRTVLMCQEQRVAYEGYDFGDDDDAGVVKYKSDFCGWGLVMGAKMDWYLGKGICLYSRAAVSVLATLHETTLKHHSDDKDSEPVDLEETFCNMRSSLETALGFSWEKEDPFKYCRYLTASFGYELHHWINVDRARRLISGSDGSHLGWWGFVFSARLDY